MTIKASGDIVSEIEIERLREEWRKADDGWIAANTKIEQLRDELTECVTTFEDLAKHPQHAEGIAAVAIERVLKALSRKD